MKALASDMDGTLFFHDKPTQWLCDDLTKIKAFQKQGHLFGICTGRPLEVLLRDTKNVIDCDFYITTSGAVVMDRHFRVIEEHLISYEEMFHIYQQYEKQAGILVQVDRQLWSLNKNHEVFSLIDDIETLKSKHIEGITLLFETDREATIVCQNINQTNGHLIGHQNKNSIDITSKECSKGQAVLAYKKYKDVQIMGGIGDSYNDVSMLQVVDQSFTFHTSPLTVQKEADHLVSSVGEAIDILIKM